MNFEGGRQRRSAESHLFFTASVEQRHRTCKGGGGGGGDLSEHVAADGNVLLRAYGARFPSAWLYTPLSLSSLSNSYLVKAGFGERLHA